MTFSDLLRRGLADAWILDEAPGALTRGMADTYGIGHGQGAGPLLSLLAPICALQTYGTAEAMDERARSMADTFDVFRDSFDVLPEPFQADLRGVAQAAHRLQAVADRLREAERHLSSEGWKFDPSGPRVVRDGAANKPYGFRRKLAVAVAVDLHPDGELRNTAPVRRKVAAVLAQFLPPEEVDPGKDGPLDRDLKAERKKREPAP